MTETTSHPSVEDVLRAIGKGSLHHLCPPEDARLIAAATARVEAGIVLSLDDRRAIARQLQGVARYLDGPLAHFGLTIPPLPEPAHRQPTSSVTEMECKLFMLSNGKIGIISPFALKDTIQGLPGAGWDRGRKCWTVPATPSAAAAALETLSATGYRARPAVLELAEAHQEARAARSILLDGSPMPEGDGTDVVTMPLWSHQLRAVAYAEVAQASVWAIKMGGGKTGAAIAAANRVQAQTVLIVAPNRVRAVWPREVRERSAVGWHIEDGTRPSARKGGRRQDLKHPERLARLQHVLWDCNCGAPVHAFVINYEAMMQRVWQDWTPPQKIDLVIYDEAHRLKAYKIKVPPRRKKGPAERALHSNATAEEILAARREDAIGPREREAREKQIEGPQLRLAQQLDKAEARNEAEARANKLTVSGLAHRWVAWSHRRIALTGTPWPQHPWDIFGLYRAIDPGIFGELWEPFRKKYIQMDRGGTFPIKIKPGEMADFADACLSLMYRPKVDLKLPGFIDVERTVELEDEARKVYDELDEQLWTDLRAWLDTGCDVPQIEVDGELIDVDLDELANPTRLTANHVLTRLLRLQQLTGGTLRSDPVELPDGRIVPGPEARISTAKSEELAEVLEEIGCVAPEKGSDNHAEPVVVFCRFKSDLDAVKAVAEAAKLRYAEISGRRSDGLNADARMQEDCDIVGVQIAAGGTGVDLTRARYCVWYSLGYSVSDYDQARARVYRPGQHRPVVYIHLIAEETQDRAVYQAIQARRSAVAAVLLAGGVDPADVGIVQEVITPAEQLAFDGMDIDSAGSAVAVPWKE